MLRSSGLVRRQRRGGGNPPAPSVTLAVGDAASNTLKFTLTLSDADKCTYVCTKSSEAVPSAEKILADGKSVTASGLITIGDLEPSTTYRLSAVASNGKVNGKVETIEHTTSAPDVHPAVVLTPGTPTSTTLSFTAALTDPETAAYVCLEKTEGTTVPTAEEILRDGTAIAQTGELLVENLKPATVYLIAAAVANTGVYSEVETLEMETVARTPVVTVIAGTPTETTLSFHFKLTDAEKAAYVCIEKPDDSFGRGDSPRRHRPARIGRCSGDPGAETRHDLYRRRRRVEQNGILRRQDGRDDHRPSRRRPDRVRPAGSRRILSHREQLHR